MWKAFEEIKDDQAKMLQEAVAEADAVVVGIGAGM